MKYRLRHETWDGDEYWTAEKEVNGGWINISDACDYKDTAMQWIRADKMCSEQPVSVEYEDV